MFPRLDSMQNLPEMPVKDLRKFVGRKVNLIYSHSLGAEGTLFIRYRDIEDGFVDERGGTNYHVKNIINGRDFGWLGVSVGAIIEVDRKSFYVGQGEQLRKILEEEERKEEESQERRRVKWEKEGAEWRRLHGPLPNRVTLDDVQNELREPCYARDGDCR